MATMRGRMVRKTNVPTATRETQFSAGRQCVGSFREYSHAAGPVRRPPSHVLHRVSRGPHNSATLPARHTARHPLQAPQKLPASALSEVPSCVRRATSGRTRTAAAPVTSSKTNAVSHHTPRGPPRPSTPPAFTLLAARAQKAPLLLHAPCPWRRTRPTPNYSAPL